MIEKETVFILGAGASKPYQYPTGDELRKYICDDYNMPFDKNSINRFPEDEFEYFKERFKSAGPAISIDKFLSTNSSNDIFNKIGRFGIITKITDSEIKSEESLHNDNENWISLLLNKMTSPSEDGYENFCNNRVHFITFNYDRSFEHYLFDAFKSVYITKFRSDGGYDNIAEILKYFKPDILHIYGCIAPLNWEDTNNGVGYGNKWNNLDLYAYIENIKIIYDDRKENKDILRARSLIEKAKRIYFLGFGYDEDNLNLLGLSNILKNESDKKIFGTAFECSPEKIDSIRKSIHPVYDEYFKIHAWDCKELLNVYLTDFYIK